MKNKNLLIGIIAVIVLIFLVYTFVNGKNNSTSEINAVDRIYNLDPQRDLIGQTIGDFHFVDIITNEQIHFMELNKVVMIQSFSLGCPACVKGISDYNELYDNYDIEVIYLDINPDDSVEDIKATKEEFNGRDWIWAEYQGSLLPFYEEYNFRANDMTIIMDETGKIVYADSFSVPLKRLENQLNELGV